MNPQLPDGDYDTEFPPLNAQSTQPTSLSTPVSGASRVSSGVEKLSLSPLENELSTYRCNCKCGPFPDDPLKAAYISFINSYHKVTCNKLFVLDFPLFSRLLHELMLWDRMKQKVLPELEEKNFDEWVIRNFDWFKGTSLHGQAYLKTWRKMMKLTWKEDSARIVNWQLLRSTISTDSEKQKVRTLNEEYRTMLGKKEQESGGFDENSTLK
ncbi:hypothetical protein NHQ30_002066 [Ciborinia camelliae]|nr:hypothetical protein NHQ30_002066 [Ciborinia camelliae]